MRLTSSRGLGRFRSRIGIASDAAYVNFYPFLLTPLADGQSIGEVETQGCQLPINIIQELISRFKRHK
jgi:hypothetical protein